MFSRVLLHKLYINLGCRNSIYEMSATDIEKTIPKLVILLSDGKNLSSILERVRGCVVMRTANRLQLDHCFTTTIELPRVIISRTIV